MTQLMFPRKYRVVLVFLWALCALCWALAARADAPVFSGADGAAVNGYDVVTYFDDAPQPGKPDLSVMWKGVVWHFVSIENREKFEANPRAYAPQFGGYCAYGVSQGYVVHTDPMVWRIRDGKLYLIHSEAIWARWAEDIPGHIAKANDNWPDVLASN